MPPGFPVAECLVPLVALAEGDEGAGGRGDQDRGGVTVLLRRNLSKPLGSPGYEKHWLGVHVGSSSQHTPCSHPWIAQASRRRCGCCCCRRPLITRPSRPRHPLSCLPLLRPCPVLSLCGGSVVSSPFFPSSIRSFLRTRVAVRVHGLSTTTPLDLLFYFDGLEPSLLDSTLSSSGA